MFLPTDRSVQFPNRYELAPVAGTDNIADLTPAPGEVSDPGTLWNRQAARQMQADLRTLPIAPGYSVSAGDVVDVSGGQIVKTVEAVANVENVIKRNTVTDTAVCYLNSAYSVMVYAISNATYARLIDNSTGVAVGSEVSVYSGSATNLSLARLSDTQFVVGYVVSDVLRVKVGTVSGTSITFGVEFNAGSITGGYNAIVALSPTSLFAAFRSGAGLFGYPLAVNGSIITNAGAAVNLLSVTANKLSATLLPDDASGNHRVCVCFSDSGDGSKGKAVIATIDSANQVTWGSVVTFNDVNIGNTSCCASGNDCVVLYVSAYSNNKLSLLKVIGNSISIGGSSETDASGNGFVSLSPAGNSFVAVYGGHYAVPVSRNGDTLSVGQSYSYAESTNDPSSASISDNKVIVAYHDNGNSGYGTTTILEVMGNQIAGSFTDESSTAIALQSGTAGQSIECIFSGTTNAAWVTEGQVIDSSGVYGVGIMDGILQVWSKDMPGMFVVGTYTGNSDNVDNAQNAQEITLGFSPKFVIVSYNYNVQVNSGSGIFSDVGYFGTKDFSPIVGISGQEYPAFKITETGFIVASIKSSTTVHYPALNTNGFVYRYVAFR